MKNQIIINHERMLKMRELGDPYFDLLGKLVMEGREIQEAVDLCWDKFKCTECDGTGKDFYSCCGVDMRGQDHDFCPDCHEHTGWSGDLKDCEDCDACNGLGVTLTN